MVESAEDWRRGVHGAASAGCWRIGSARLRGAGCDSTVYRQHSSDLLAHFLAGTWAIPWRLGGSIKVVSRESAEQVLPERPPAEVQADGKTEEPR